MSKVKELEKNKVQIEVQVGKDAFLEAINKAYLKNKGRFNIPGFRKGKAPRHMIENYYGENVFFEDAFDIAFPEAYRAAVEESCVKVIFWFPSKFCL